MEKIIKNLLAHVSPRETRELVQTHVKRVEVDTSTNNVKLYVDKRYAFNLLTSHDHVQKITAGVKKAFGENYTTTIKLESANAVSEREKALPHSIHYP